MSSVTFYTAEINRNAIVYGTWYSQGVGTDNLFDGNLNTSWKANSTYMTDSFLIDTCPQDETAYNAGRGVPSGSLDTLGVWLPNYSNNHPNTRWELFYSKHVPISSVPSNTDWIYSHGGGGGLGTVYWTGITEFPIWLNSWSTSYQRRFYRIALWTNISHRIEIGQFFLMKKRTIQTRPEYPLKKNAEYFNDVVTMGGGKEYVSAQAQNCIYNFDQKYTFLSEANKTAFDDVFHACSGQLMPFIYQPDEGLDITKAHLCRLISNKDVTTEPYNHYYKSGLKFKTLPFIEDRQNF